MGTSVAKSEVLSSPKLSKDCVISIAVVPISGSQNEMFNYCTSPISAYKNEQLFPRDQFEHCTFFPINVSGVERKIREAAISSHFHAVRRTAQFF
jgi:hypothetical protein